VSAPGGETATVSAPGVGTATVSASGVGTATVNASGGQTATLSAPGVGTAAVTVPGGETAATFRIVRGQPTAADLAALTAVLLSRMAAAEPYGDDCAGPPRTAGWRRPERAAPHRDPRGWRASGSGTG